VNRGKQGLGFAAPGDDPYEMREAAVIITRKHRVFVEHQIPWRLGACGAQPLAQPVDYGLKTCDHLPVIGARLVRVDPHARSKATRSGTSGLHWRQIGNHTPQRASAGARITRASIDHTSGSLSMKRTNRTGLPNDYGMKLFLLSNKGWG
jgi:hypothetical protein